MADLVTHKGGCHCRAVRYEVDAPGALTIWDCNCSICAMKRNTHFVVPAERFHLAPASEPFLTSYRFNTRKAEHKFCKVCGICSFYTPRSNPDGVAVTAHCLDPGTVTSVTVSTFDGQNWEQNYKASGIAALSKP